MTEQDFIANLTEIGYTQEEIDSAIEISQKMKITFPDMTYEELIENAIKAQEETDSELKGVLTF